MKENSEAGFNYIELIMVIMILALIVKSVLFCASSIVYPARLQENAWRLMSLAQSVQQENIYGRKFNSKKRAVLELKGFEYRLRRNGIGNKIDKWIKFSPDIRNQWRAQCELDFDKEGRPKGVDHVTLYDNKSKKSMKIIITEMTGRITVQR